MSILKTVKQRAQHHIENKRIKREARLYEEIEISKTYSAFSLAQIKDLIVHEELKLARMFALNPNKKQQQILVAGLHRAKRLIKARKESLERQSSIANAPVVVIKKKAA